ncbi:hypothetical protein [Porphyromonas gingivalis]|mgnify:FL=1|uniref:Uncharacterized protein n=5 Tax=Viruses TaxID=10239 RepID=A0AAT9JM81_9CAUD|nr:hypothetical protein [Porphyromonas gingivalis]ATS05545.1 hypothetical protein CS387_00065 [Porphyromonas gingivalis]ATS06057.1 hypothetical protein CS387_03105 [Porphyromonas gingivalis]ERJ70611.1 hypothetical protein HMPREF1553_00156 [Porphyromonas gingivalis F0568]MCE8187104.1 hypothetical protein [Porphyromonas gingivalis]MCE8191124.1 hypothetical protein [Porphyromonas gingivalis]
MRTTNQFSFRAQGKDPKELVRSCINEMLEMLPDGNGFQLSAHLDVRRWTTDAGEKVFIVESGLDSPTAVSFSIVRTLSEEVSDE